MLSLKFICNAVNNKHALAFSLSSINMMMLYLFIRGNIHLITERLIMKLSNIRKKIRSKYFRKRMKICFEMRPPAFFLDEFR